MGCEPCLNCLLCVVGELISVKIDFLKISQLGDELYKKANVSGSFLSRVRVIEPGPVAAKIKVSDWDDVRTEEGFEHELTDVLLSVSIKTELAHIENLDGRIVLDDLS